MKKNLRTYQRKLKADIYEGWRTVTQHRQTATVLACTATGSGKTVTMASIAQDIADGDMALPGIPGVRGGHGVIVAHRAELVGQISLAMAGEGLRHNVLASGTVVKGIVGKHMDVLKGSYYDPRARWSVASVDTLLRRGHPEPERVGWVFTDEGHHVLAANKWGRGVAMFEHAHGLLMTATPTRADGMGLGRHHDGLADLLVTGPGLAQLIGEGFLVGYRVLKTVPTDLNLNGLHITASGDFNQTEAASAVKASRQIVGDAVRIYHEHCAGKLAILFSPDVAQAEIMKLAFGACAAVLSGTDSEAVRDGILRDFKARKITVLINVDLFGEGFDVPACEVVIMCRPTASFALFAQQIGRALRLDISPLLMGAWDTYSVAQRKQFIAESPKPQATAIDLVGNVGRTYKVGELDYVGLPEGFTAWTLDRRPRARKTGDGIPVRKCLKCGKDYERVDSACPFCGTAAPAPAGRSTPVQVDGDVFELEGELLARMRGEVWEALDGAKAKVSDAWLQADPRTARMAAAAADAKMYATQGLIAQINKWADAQGHDHNKSAKLFYFTFGMDVLTALSQSASKCSELAARISKEIKND